MSRSGALDRIDTLLSGVTDPTFTAVLRGEPLSVSGTPLCAFWITNRVSTKATLNDMTTMQTFMIRSYFRMQVSSSVRENIELDLWDAAVNIDTALRGDATLDNNVNDSSVGAIATGYTDIGGVAYRTLDVPFNVEILGEVPIAP